MGGSYHVDRRNKFSLKNEIREIQELLHDGFPVFLFPEATSSNGSEILPFKRALLEAGVRSKALVFPFCINYLAIDGEPVSAGNRDRIFFYGDIEFVDSIGRLIRTRRIDVEVVGLPAVQVQEGDDSRILCQKLEEEIKARHKPIQGST